ncbi:MAG TPA: prepilin-type N-terminal cleavage/methylation domain-containing protein, partial [Desulfobacterales bacterium]|nr:prepilin-type N-terminal cleavage/methylation domain-containing protein [Desulfobacterales bacterium]
MPDLLKNERGFTLVEIMIALLMASLVMAAIYTTTNKQQDVYVDQDQVVAMQDNLRAAMLMMTSEIKMAGYDPLGLANAGFTVAKANTMTFTMDLNGDGDVNDPSEKITYDLYTSGTQRLGRKNPTTNMPVADNISNLEFYYTLANGNQTLTPTNPADIRAVQITVLAITAVSTNNNFGKTSFTTPSGATWTLTSGFRGRM